MKVKQKVIFQEFNNRQEILTASKNQKKDKLISNIQNTKIENNQLTSYLLKAKFSFSPALSYLSAMSTLFSKNERNSNLQQIAKVQQSEEIREKKKLNSMTVEAVHCAALRALDEGARLQYGPRYVEQKEAYPLPNINLWNNRERKTQPNKAIDMPCFKTATGNPGGDPPGGSQTITIFEEKPKVLYLKLKNRTFEKSSQD